MFFILSVSMAYLTSLSSSLGYSPANVVSVCTNWSFFREEAFTDIFNFPAFSTKGCDHKLFGTSPPIIMAHYTSSSLEDNRHNL